MQVPDALISELCQNIRLLLQSPILIAMGCQQKVVGINTNKNLQFGVR